MAIISKTGTPIIKNISHPGVVFNRYNDFQNPKPYLETESGLLFACVSKNRDNDDYVIEYSTDNGYTWTRFIDLYDIGGLSTSIIRDHPHLVYFEKLKWWMVAVPLSTGDVFYSIIFIDGDGVVDYTTFISIVSENNIFTMCNDDNYAYIAYTASGSLRMIAFDVLNLSEATAIIQYNINGDYSAGVAVDSCTDGNGNIYVLSVADDTPGAHDIYYLMVNKFRSELQNWEEAVVVYDNSPSASFTPEFPKNPAICIDGKGTLCVMWTQLDFKSYTKMTDSTPYYSISTDDGVTWSTPVSLGDVAGYTSYVCPLDGTITPTASYGQEPFLGPNDMVGNINGGFILSYTRDYTAGTNRRVQIDDMYCEADDAADMGVYGRRWTFHVNTSFADRYNVWYNVSGSNNPPSSSIGGVMIEVVISTNDDAAAVALATKNAINASVASADIVAETFTETERGTGYLRLTHTATGINKSINLAGMNPAWTGRVSFLAQRGHGHPRALVRQLTTDDDGVTYTLGEQKDATGVALTEATVGCKFFKLSEGNLQNLDEPGLARVTYRIGEVEDYLDAAQDLLSVSPYPISYPSEESEYIVETAGEGELLITFEVVSGMSDNIDYYTEGYTGTNTTEYLQAFIDNGTSVRLLTYEPNDAVTNNGRLAYLEPTETWAKVFMDPISYRSPGIPEDASLTGEYVEQDIRKIYLPPDIYISREFVRNVAGRVKRTVWLMVFGGNEYEITQVVPHFINNEITHYEANAYVSGPSYDPFDRAVLLSET